MLAGQRKALAAAVSQPPCLTKFADRRRSERNERRRCSPGKPISRLAACAAPIGRLAIPDFRETRVSRSQEKDTLVKIITGALILALIWTAALILIARTVGLHSTPGMWTGAVGLPGVVIANWTQAQLFHSFHRNVGYSLMFLINWGFYCSVLQGSVSLKRRSWVH